MLDNLHNVQSKSRLYLVECSFRFTRCFEYVIVSEVFGSGGLSGGSFVASLERTTFSAY